MFRNSIYSIFILLLLHGTVYGQGKSSLHILSIGVNQEAAKYPESDATRLPGILQNHVQASSYKFEGHCLINLVCYRYCMLISLWRETGYHHSK